MENVFKVQIVTIAALFATCLHAYALPSITGEMGMFGNFYTVDSNWNPTSTGSATGVNFQPNLFGVAGTTTGSFAGIEVAGPGTIKDFQFDPGLGVNDGSDGVTPVQSIQAFWSIGDFSFELTSVTRGFTNDPAAFLVLQGTGIISASGYLDTYGTWEFSGNTTTSQGDGSFSWSAGSASIAIPEPGMLALIGAGLIGLVGFGKKRASKIK